MVDDYGQLDTVTRPQDRARGALVTPISLFYEWCACLACLMALSCHFILSKLVDCPCLIPIRIPIYHALRWRRPLHCGSCASRMPIHWHHRYTIRVPSTSLSPNDFDTLSFFPIGIAFVRTQLFIDLMIFTPSYPSDPLITQVKNDTANYSSTSRLTSFTRYPLLSFSHAPSLAN
jgi:hypothetical protein